LFSVAVDFDTGGAMLAHQQRGEGSKPVVLLHGFLGSSRNLGPLVRSWESRADSRFLALDLPGHGRSTEVPPRSLDDMAAHVAEAMKVHRFEGAWIVGHSLGARVGLALRRIGAQPAGVVMLDMTPGPVGPTETQAVIEALLDAPPSAPDRETMRQALAALPRHLVDWLSMNLERQPDGSVRWRFDRRALVEFHGLHSSEDLWPQAAQDPGRTPAVLGGASRYVPPADAERMAALGQPVLQIEGAGHFVHVEAPDRIVAWCTARMG
jgi:esterase